MYHFKMVSESCVWSLHNSKQTVTGRTLVGNINDKNRIIKRAPRRIRRRVQNLIDCHDINNANSSMRLEPHVIG